VGVVLIVGLLSALAVLAVFAAIYVAVERPDDMNERLEAYAGRARQAGSAPVGEARGKSLLVRLLARLLGARAPAQRLALRLAQADLRLTVPEFLIVVFSAGIVGGVLGQLLQGQLISAISGAALAMAAPWLWLERRRGKRLKAFHDQLIDVVVLIVGSLRSGHGLLNALDLVAKEMDAPARDEFGRVLREIGFGVSQTEALNNLVRRMESDDLHLMVTAINITHEVGGNLSEVLEKIAGTLRERIQLHGEIRVLTTQQRLTTYLLVSMPFFLGACLALLNPAYMLGIFQPPWIVIPLAALAAELVGFVITQRVTRIEV